MLQITKQSGIQSISTSLTQWWNFGSSSVDGEFEKKTVKDTAAGELTPDPLPQLANRTGPNRTRAQWKFTNVYHHR